MHHPRCVDSFDRALLTHGYSSYSDAQPCHNPSHGDFPFGRLGCAQINACTVSTSGDGVYYRAEPACDRRHYYGDTVVSAKRLLARCARGCSPVQSSAHTQCRTNEAYGALLIRVIELSDGCYVIAHFRHVFKICFLFMNLLDLETL